MSRRSVDRCDRCGVEIESAGSPASPLNTVSVVVSELKKWGGSGVPWRDGKRLEAQWCLKCCQQLGVMDPGPEHEQDAKTPALPTIEDMIREIVREEIENQQ